MTKPVIGFAGLSHLGICSSAAAAAKGFQTIGYDGDAELITKLRNGEPPIVEPGLNETLLNSMHRLDFSHEVTALGKCDIVYISRDVPTNDLGISDLTAIHEILSTIEPHLKLETVVVVLCQVPPGFTRSLKTSSSGMFYQVETLIFGRAMERAEEPERVIVGCKDPSQSLPEPYQVFLNAFNCPILPMRYESAELSKIAINCFLVSSVSTTNTLAEICEKIGADWPEIVPALRLDKRIGEYAYLSPGLGIAGGNLERDLATVIGLSRDHQTDAGSIEAWITNSQHRRDWAIDQLQENLLIKTPDPVIAVWGLAYKENTKSTKNSPSLALLNKLRGHNVKVYDPAVSIELPGKDMIQTTHAMDAVTGADALVIMTPWPEFSNYEPGALKTSMSGNLLIDPFGVLDKRTCLKSGFQQFIMGASMIDEPDEDI